MSIVPFPSSTGRVGMSADPVTAVLSRALDGLQARQRVIAANVANLETPGYQARRIDFEDSLRRAHADGDLLRSSIAESTSTDPARANGNNVSIDSELMLEQETILRQRLVVEALNGRFSMMRAAIGAWGG